MAQAPLICFDIIEWHLPDCVLRQLGRLRVCFTALEFLVCATKLDILKHHEAKVAASHQRDATEQTGSPSNKKHTQVAYYISNTQP